MDPLPPPDSDQQPEPAERHVGATWGVVALVVGVAAVILANATAMTAAKPFSAGPTAGGY